jgi:hypothetical protein
MSEPMLLAWDVPGSSAKRTQSGRSVRRLYPNLVVQGTANPLFAAEISVIFSV